MLVFYLGLLPQFVSPDSSPIVWLGHALVLPLLGTFWLFGVVAFGRRGPRAVAASACSPGHGCRHWWAAHRLRSEGRRRRLIHFVGLVPVVRLGALEPG